MENLKDIQGRFDKTHYGFVVSLSFWVVLISGHTGDLGFPPYDPMSLCFLTEVSKLIISLIFWWKSGEGLPVMKKSLLKDLGFMILPATVFSLFHLFDIHFLSRYSPSFFFVLLQTRVIFTALIHGYFFPALTVSKFLPSVALFAAALLVPYPIRSGYGSFGSLSASLMIISLVIAFLSSYGIVFCEFLYKYELRHHSYWMKNCMLYSLSSFVTFVFIMVTKSDVFPIFFEGYTIYTFLACVAGCTFGILSTYILHHSNSNEIESLRVVSLLKLSIFHFFHHGFPNIYPTMLSAFLYYIHKRNFKLFRQSYLQNE